MLQILPMKKMNYSNITTRIIYLRLYTFSWTSMFRITFRHLSTGFAHLSLQILHLLCNLKSVLYNRDTKAQQKLFRYVLLLDVLNIKTPVIRAPLIWNRCLFFNSQEHFGNFRAGVIIQEHQNCLLRPTFLLSRFKNKQRVLLCETVAREEGLGFNIHIQNIYLGEHTGCPVAPLREIYQSVGHLGHLVSRNLM